MPAPRSITAALIPADPTKPVQIVLADYHNLAGAIGAQWFELVRTDQLRRRRWVLVVDEEGLLNNAAPNRRATMFYPHGLGICGDALICAETFTSEGPDLVSLSPFQVGAIAGLAELAAVPA